MYLLINKCVTAVKVSNFFGHYLRNRSTLDVGVLGYIGIVQHKEHSPEVLSIPPGTFCIFVGRDFPHPSRPALGPTRPPIPWVRRLSRRQSGRNVALITHPSSVEVKERVELYFYSSSGPSWFVLGWPLPLTIFSLTPRILFRSQPYEFWYGIGL